MKVSHVEVIERGVTEVWKAFEDPEAILEWQTNVESFEQLEGSFNKVGGVAQMRIRQTGLTSDVTVTVLKRKRFHVTYGYEGAQAPFEIANSFKSLGRGRTEWTAVLELKLNILTRALGPVLKPVAGELVKNNGRNFREYMEARVG